MIESRLSFFFYLPGPLRCGRSRLSTAFYPLYFVFSSSLPLHSHPFTRIYWMPPATYLVFNITCQCQLLQAAIFSLHDRDISNISDSKCSFYSYFPQIFLVNHIFHAIVSLSFYTTIFLLDFSSVMRLFNIHIGETVLRKSSALFFLRKCFYIAILCFAFERHFFLFFFIPMHHLKAVSLLSSVKTIPRDFHFLSCLISCLQFAFWMVPLLPAATDSIDLLEMLNAFFLQEFLQFLVFAAKTWSKKL